MELKQRNKNKQKWYKKHVVDLQNANCLWWWRREEEGGGEEEEGGREGGGGGGGGREEGLASVQQVAKPSDRLHKHRMAQRKSPS